MARAETLNPTLEPTVSNSQLWWIAFRQRSVWVRGAKLGLSVGVLQAIINQGDVWLDHSATAGTVAKTIISPLVTFAVALISAAATVVEKLKVQPRAACDSKTNQTSPALPELKTV